MGLDTYFIKSLETPSGKSLSKTLCSFGKDSQFMVDFFREKSMDRGNCGDIPLDKNLIENLLKHESIEKWQEDELNRILEEIDEEFLY